MDNFLVTTITHIEQQYAVIERECILLRNLLKPWPKDKLQSQVNTVQVDQQAEEHGKQKTDGLTPREKLALDQMDRLLSKAQKTIKIKEKIAKSERSSATDSNCTKPTSAQECSEIGDNDTNATMKNIPNGDTDECKTEDVHSVASEKVITKKKEVIAVKKNPLQNKVASASSVKDAKSSQQVFSSSHTSKGITPCPSSASSRPSSSRSRYTPVHINAPFKTEINTCVAHRKHNHIYKNHQIVKKHQNKKTSTLVAVQKQPPHLNGLKTLPKISPAMRENETGDVSANLVENDITVVDDTSCSIKSSKADSDSACTPSFSQDVEDANLNEFSPEYSNPKEPKASSHSHATVNSDPTFLKEGDFFSLKDKSSHIKVPHRLHKLVEENNILLERCSTAKLIKKMPNADAAVNFLERLNETNEVSQELWAKAKALSCLQSHILMLESLHSLEIDAMTGATPYEAVYRAKRLLEFILAKFAEIQEEADYFSKVQFRPSLYSGPTLSISPSGANDEILKSLFSNQDTEVTMHNSEPFVMGALRYSKQWTRLQFEKRLYQLQCHLLSLSQDEWWQTLSQEPKNGSIVQMMHSLLTSSGEFFPAIVENPYS